MFDDALGPDTLVGIGLSTPAAALAATPAASLHERGHEGPRRAGERGSGGWLFLFVVMSLGGPVGCVETGTIPQQPHATLAWNSLHHPLSTDPIPSPGGGRSPAWHSFPSMGHAQQEEGCPDSYPRP